MLERLALYLLFSFSVLIKIMWTIVFSCPFYILYIRWANIADITFLSLEIYIPPEIWFFYVSFRYINLVNATWALKQQEKPPPLLRLITLQLYISVETCTLGAGATLFFLFCCNNYNYWNSPILKALKDS